jgi:nitrite reductase (NADH) large subunit
VQRLMDSDRGLAGVLTRKGERLDTQLVFPAVGFQPDTGPARKAGLEVGTGIRVNEYLQTSDPDVYAAGDTIEMAPNGGLPMGQGWLPAYEEGKIAALNMLGSQVKYGGKVRRYSVRVFDMDVAVLGDSIGSGPGYEERSELFEEAGVYKRLNLKDGVLVGALLVGNITEASKLETAIREHRRLKELSSSFLRQLFDGSYLLTGNFGVVCHVCKYQMTLERPPEEGQVLTCPVCGVEFKMVRLAGRLVARSL